MKMQKEPEYYGKAGYVNEGLTLDLGDLTYNELKLIAYKAYGEGDSYLEKTAHNAMRKKFLNSVKLLFEEIDKREQFEDAFYLTCLTEIIREGAANHREDLIVLWPYLKEKADMLHTNLRINPNCQARKKYQNERNIADAVIEQYENEGLIKHG